MSLRFIRQTLYSLTRNYGAPADIYRNTSAAVDNSTGVTIVQRSVVRCRRVIRLPDNRSRQFAYDIAFLAANKNFTYGGTWDTGKRSFVVLASELVGFVPTIGDWVVHDSKRWDVKKVEELDYKQGYLLETAQVDGDELCRIIEVSFVQGINIIHGASYGF